MRTKQRAEEVAEREGVYATENLDEALKTNPDFAVLCVPRTMKEILSIDGSRGSVFVQHQRHRMQQNFVNCRR